MASTTVINANATSKPQQSTSAPIEPLKNDTARLYTHIHPILVLSLYALKFPALVADPTSTLLSTLAPLAVLQIAFVAVCLPPTGGTPAIRKQKPGEKKGRAPGKLEQGLNSKIVVRLPLLRIPQYGC
jgi:phosphatidylinositol glycan class F